MAGERPQVDRLVAPLKYASHRGFSKLSTVKSLRPLLEATLKDLQKAPRPDAKLVTALKAAIPEVDTSSQTRRREVITSLIDVLTEAGLFSPPPEDAAPERIHAPPVKERSAPSPKMELKKLMSIAPREGPLARPLKEIGGRLNPRLVGTLAKKGMTRIGDVLFLLPRAYEDRRVISKIADLLPGERGTTTAIVKSAGEVRFRPGRKLFRAVLADDTGSISVAYFQSGPWLKAKFPVGKRLLISGDLRVTAAGREMAHPEVEPADDLETSSVHFGRLTPIYPGFERHEQRQFRDLAFRVAEAHAKDVEEPLPESVRQSMGLVGLPDALHTIHFPPPTEDLDALNNHQTRAHRRLAFDELFFLQLGMALKKLAVKAEAGIAFTINDKRIAKAKKALPFEMTKAQARVLAEIAKDMARPEPMHRLVQGDVGSGKTAVAATAAILALEDGYQAALMAPTEILANQHYKTLTKILRPLGYEVGLITAGGTPKERAQARERLKDGKTHVAVGTHALIQEAAEFKRLGLAIVDEQHRFGVLQRHALMGKGARPDVLVLTATPIPRTLAMTLYGDLDLSVIDELPPGRTPIVTRAFGERQRARLYEAMAKEMKAGRQCYVVYPLVEESEKIDLKDATQGAETLKGVFPESRVGLLHGRMKQDEKDAVMANFRAGKLDILVATTVIEVGVDVPNASVMVVEHAERFGLTQLHQLRGRVGRGAAQSYCFLVAAGGKSEGASERLAVMVESNDGFVIAQKDLELRGPGEFLGIRQSGVPELAVANLARDQALLAQASALARDILDKDPTLAAPQHAGLRKALEDRWEGRLSLARVG